MTMFASRRGIQLLIGAVVVVAAVAVTALVSSLGAFAGTAGRNTTPAAASDPVTVNTIAASPNTVTVIGTGQVNAAPDQAQVGLGVAAQRGTVSAALSAANADMARLLAALHREGIVAQDIQTSIVSINQDTVCCTTVSGYTATNGVMVTIHHLANVGPVINAAVVSVGNDISLNGVTLGLSTETHQLSTARVAAMADARVHAAQWAAETGRTLGPILAVSEVVDNGTGGSACTSGCGGGGAGPPIEAGQTTVSVSVTVVFKLQ
jgi:uncharacterized protein